MPTPQTIAIISVFCLVAAAPAAAPAGEKAAKEAGTAEAAKAKPGRTRIVVYPFEAINVSPGTARAASELLESSLQGEGFDVLAWEPELERRGVESRPPAPAPPQPPVMVAPSADGAGVAPLVDHAQPPPPPGSVRPAPVYQAAPPRVWSPPPPQPAPAPVPAGPPVIGSALKGEIARELGCDYYIDGSLIRLGSLIRVTVHKRDFDGATLDSRQMEAKTEDDLRSVLTRISIAFAEAKTIEETLSLDNATRAEAEHLPERFRLEKNFGLVIGQAFGVDQTMRHYTMFAFDGRLEFDDIMVELSAGFAFSADGDESDTAMQLLVDLGVAYYLSHTSVSPYIGLGMGVFFGDRIDRDEEHVSSASAYDRDERDDEGVGVGFEAFPLIGVEFLRQSSIRVHVDFRYVFGWTAEDKVELGHGPMALIGINF